MDLKMMFSQCCQFSRIQLPMEHSEIIDVMTMNEKDFTGTLTSTEIRKTIFEDVLGYKQDDLAGVKTGYNKVRTITFKLKQQFDVDELFEWEYFDFERSIGKEVNVISCKIRGLRDPNKRRATNVHENRSAPVPAQPYIDAYLPSFPPFRLTHNILSNLKIRLAYYICHNYFSCL